jgi:hypothetical protein
MNGRTLAIGILGCLVAAGCAASTASHEWRLEQIDSIGGFAPEVIGAPGAREKDGVKALCFDGKSDGLLLPVNPIAGLGKFTIEILFHPDGDGPAEQRFLHIQDELERRVLMETRVSEDHTWSLDTFLRATDADKLTLLDRAKSQPTDQWYWAALVYDGKTMRHYVNGEKQLEGEVTFTATGPGRISLGVRQNRIHWFKGCIARVRFSGSALEPAALRRR